jgi:hypothetical protein
MKKMLLFIILPALILIPAGFEVRAESGDDSGSSSRVRIRQEINTRSQVSVSTSTGTRETIREQVRTRNEEIKNKISSRVGELKERISRRAIIINAKVTAVSTASLTVEKDGKSIVVNITEDTKIVRRYYGKTDLSEINIGHQVTVFGLWTDDAETAIDAKLIRDLSIQKRFGVFVGEVTAISGSQITVQTIHRGIQTAEVSNATKLVNRKMQPITIADIKVGHRIRVKGTWDRSVNYISEVTQVKDYSLPEIKVTPVKSTATPIPLETPLPTSVPI